MREINFRYPEMTILWANGPVPDAGDPIPEDIHAGRGETSTLLHFRPDLVKSATTAMDSPGIVGQEFNDYVGFDKSTATGAWGRPTAASAEQGAERTARSVEHEVAYFRWARARVAELKAQRSVVPERTED
jgi:creatinine amidohydrolase/Fe(II)-dependent formamide hydrolase-like protein